LHPLFLSAANPIKVTAVGKSEKLCVETE